jgi:hypothetical protein
MEDDSTTAATLPNVAWIACSAVLSLGTASCAFGKQLLLVSGRHNLCVFLRRMIVILSGEAREALWPRDTRCKTHNAELEPTRRRPLPTV